VAPAWLLSEGTWQALRESPFEYTCTLRQIHFLARGEVIVAQSQAYSTRSAWRRATSVGWNRLLARVQWRQACVRLELHPPDAEHDAVRCCWQRLLRRQLRTREPVTLSALARRAGAASPASEQQQHELRGREANGPADRDVARVVQSQHHA